MASSIQWTWVWVDSGCWWWTERLGMLQFMGSQRTRHDWATELNWTYTWGDWASKRKINFFPKGLTAELRRDGGLPISWNSIMLSFLGVILGLSFTNKKKSFKKITLFKVTQVPPLIHLSQLSYFLFHKTVYLVYLLKTLEAHGSSWKGGDTISITKWSVKTFIMCFYSNGFGLHSQILLRLQVWPWLDLF